MTIRLLSGLGLASGLYLTYAYVLFGPVYGCMCLGDNCPSCPTPTSYLVLGLAGIALVVASAVVLAVSLARRKGMPVPPKEAVN